MHSGLLPSIDTLQFVEKYLSLVFFGGDVNKAKIEYGYQGKNFVVISDGFEVGRYIIEPDSKEVEDSEDCRGDNDAHKSDRLLAFISSTRIGIVGQESYVYCFCSTGLT